MTVRLSGEFSFGNDGTQASSEIKEAISNWEEILVPEMPRIMFSESGVNVMTIEIEDIYDTDKEIRVKTEPGSTVNIYDEEGNKIDIYPIEDDGVFKFELEEPLNAGDVLKFDAVHDHHESPEVEKVVIGNRLEFVTPPEGMIFETTEIKDEETIIERKNDWNLAVNNTKPNNHWKVEAEVKEPLTNINNDNDTLENAMIYKDGANEKYLEDGSVEIARKNATDPPGQIEINWQENEGILIKINPIMAKPDTEYSTTIEWTLTDGP